MTLGHLVVPGAPGSTKGHIIREDMKLPHDPFLSTIPECAAAATAYTELSAQARGRRGAGGVPGSHAGGTHTAQPTLPSQVMPLATAPWAQHIDAFGNHCLWEHFKGSIYKSRK